MNKKKVLVCGSRFGQFYIEAIKRIGCLQLVGLLAKGSKRSMACSEFYGIKLYTQIESIPNDIDIACIAVKSEVMGGTGNILARKFLEKGIHVIFEQPLHIKEFTECYKLGLKYNSIFFVGNLYEKLPAVKNFLQNINIMKNYMQPLYINVDFATQVSYPVMCLLSMIIPNIHNWEAKGKILDMQPFQTLAAKIEGIEVVFRAHNEVDLKNSDGFLHLFFQISVGYAGGRISIIDPHGPVLWQPRVHLPENNIIPGDLLANAPLNMQDYNICTLYEADGITQQDIFTTVWIKAIEEYILDACQNIDHMDRAEIVKRAQKQIMFCQQWQLLMKELGYPAITEEATFNYISSNHFSKEVEIEYKKKSIRYGMKCLNEACYITMLFYIQKNIDNKNSYSIDDLIDNMNIVNDYRAIILRWIRELETAGYIQICGNVAKFTREKISNDRFEQAWERAEIFWNKELGVKEIFLYFKSNAINLEKIMNMKINPNTILFPDGKMDLAFLLYSETAIARELNTKISKCVSEIICDEGITVLELGSGTGATSEKIIEELRLKHKKYKYVYSDLSEYFINNAKQRFGCSSSIIYKRINIDKDLDNINEESFDAVIAVGVLNNAKNILETMRKIYKILKKRGKLLLVEAIGESMPMLISQAFMMERSYDERIDDNITFLSLEQWKTIFKKSAFDLEVIEPDAMSELNMYNQKLFILRRN